MTYQQVDNNYLKLLSSELKVLKSKTADNSVKFFNESELKKLDNNNVLKLSEIEIVHNLYQLKQIKLNSSFGIDIETTGLNPRLNKIVGIGLSDGKRHYYINLPEEPIEEDWLEEVGAWLESLFCIADKIIIHNAKFEYQFIKCFFNIEIPAEKIIDTMVYAYILGKERKLSTLAENYLGRYPMSWNELCKKCGTEDAYRIPLEEISIYCCEDAYECLLLISYFLPLLYKYYRDSNIPIIDNLNTVSISNMELEGIKIDFDKVEPLIDYCDDLMEVYTDEFSNLAVEETNINSPAKLSELLFDKMNMPTEGIVKGKSGKYSVDKNTINELLGVHPIIEVIQDYQLVRSVKRYLLSGKNDDKGLINLIDDNNFIFPNTNNCLTDTGRFSMSNPNLQQSVNPAKYLSLNNKNIAILGTKFRELFVPRKDNHRFVIADYPSFEFRILASLSNDETLKKIFNEGLDFHIIICEKLFNIVYDKNNPTHKLYRQVTKTINYGVAYGMTWLRLQRECLKVGLNYSRRKCEQILTDYWSVLPQVWVFFCREKLKALKHGFSETAWGRKRFFEFSDNYRLTDYVQNNLHSVDIYKADNDTILDVWNELSDKKLFKPEDESKFRSIQNNPMQGTNADVVRNVLNIFDGEWKQLELENGGYCKTILTVHDEFIVEASHENIEDVKKIMKYVMENSIELSVPIPIKPIVCNSWAEGK